MATIPEANKELKARAEARAERGLPKRSVFDTYGEAMETNARAQLEGIRQNVRAVANLPETAGRFARAQVDFGKRVVDAARDGATQAADSFNRGYGGDKPAQPGAPKSNAPATPGQDETKPGGNAPKKEYASFDSRPAFMQILEENNRLTQSGAALPKGLVRSEAGRYGVPIYAGRSKDGQLVFSDSASGVAAMASRVGGLRRDNPVAGDKRFEAQDMPGVDVPGFVDRELVTGQRPTLTAEDLAVFDQLSPEDQEQLRKAAGDIDTRLAEQDSIQQFRARDAQRVRENASPIAGLRRDEFDALPVEKRAELLQGAQTAQAQAASAQAKAQESQIRTQMMQQRLALDINNAVNERERNELSQIKTAVDMMTTNPEGAYTLLLGMIPPEVGKSEEAMQQFMNTRTGQYIYSMIQQDAVRGANNDKALNFFGLLDESGPATIDPSRSWGNDDFRIGFGNGRSEYADSNDFSLISRLNPDVRNMMNRYTVGLNRKEQ